MKRVLYVCLFVALLITSPLAAQRTPRPDRFVRTRDVITNPTDAPATAWDAFIAMLVRAERSLRINGVLSEPPGDDEPTVNGVLSEPPGDRQTPPPPNP